jgi:hypothetical protein
MNSKDRALVMSVAFFTFTALNRMNYVVCFSMLISLFVNPNR